MKQSNCRKKKMLCMHFFLTIILICGGYNNVTAQNQKTQVTGVITSLSDKLSLPGVSIIDVSDPRNAVNADFDGHYSIILKNGTGSLRFTMIGYKPIELKVNNRSVINVVMDLDVSALDEVVVVGYGTQKKRKVVGAIDQVNNDAFKDRPNVNATLALQGKAPSLTIQQTNSEPGAGLNLNIRGISTLGNNSPLIVIDGIVGGDINALNPADIESVSVLKDAGSAAIYGSRASNGVVLITTKKGSKSKPMSIQYSSLTGFNSPKYFTKPVHGYENAMLRNEAAFNSGETTAVFSAAKIAELKANGDTEWFAEEIVKPALQLNQNLSFSGGSDNSTYLVSLGYLDQESTFVGPKKGQERYNFRINLTNEYGKFKLTSTLAYSKQKITDHSSSTGTLMADAFRVPLYYTQKDKDGNYLTNDVLQQFNSLGILEQGGFRRYDNDDIFGAFNAEFKLSNSLKVKGVFGGRLWSGSMYSRVKEVNFSPQGVYGADRDTNDETRKSLDLNTQFMLEYSKSFGNHNVGGLIGVSNENHSDRGIGIYKKYTDPDLGTPTSETVIGENSYNSNGSSSKNSLNSLFGRASYDFKDKYFAEFSFRYDGSSKFRDELRWGFFPSGTLGYALTKESFMENYNDKVGNIKLRASYGILGNQNVGNYQYQTTYFTFQNAYGFNNSGVSGTGYNFANPDIQWEKAATFNAGIDADFFKGALSFSFDYFDKVTSDILVPPQVPGVFGTGLPMFNAGKVGNKGWEISATYRHKGKVLNHSLMVNFGDSKNKVLDYGGKERLSGVEELQVILREGLPFNSYVGLKRDGIFQNWDEIKGAAVPEGLSVQPGDNRYVDVNKDGKIDDNDKFVFGNPFPRYTYGATYNLDYKNFDLSIFIQGVGKRTMMIRGELVEPFHYNYGMTMYTHQLDYWTPQNPDARYPRLANNGTQSNTNNFRRGSDMYLYDGAYARLKNVQIGYSLSDDVAQRLGMSRFHVYVSGQNLLTLSKVKFVDPELSEFNNSMTPSGANSGRAYPTQVYYGMGIDITF
ncbi:SusC/RagA family TonB-linked outer membrane protein [Flavobacterium piscis]|uniref:SusC/RagA family TonB-linked outer membrane protein n=2 Tax=Flavobacterium piscis TaxID=1114874 RepID=A0ABX2XMB1_9FLAO|nr:SusC/RagA family TonB-linked outer membrane protein [Flavobacterium piscis]OXG06385.1 SusC/RagA family TonB-linked outer membrane protein [Flavobacterium piscis]